MNKIINAKNFENFLLYFYLISLGILFIVPMVFTIVSSLKNNTEIFSTPFALPTVYRFQNYIDAWVKGQIGQFFINSVVISVLTVLGTVLLSSMVSFVLSRFEFKMNKLLYLFFIIGLMIPIQSVLVPIAYLIGFFGLKNNLSALILVYIAFSLPFSIMVLTAFMKGINNSLIEASIVDGANYWQVYWHIIMPMSVPALSTISIFNFLGAWNNIIFPLLFINDNRLKPLSIGLLNFHSERGSDYGALMAAITITVTIPLIMYMLFQEKVEGGLAAGAVKE